MSAIAWLSLMNPVVDGVMQSWLSYTLLAFSFLVVYYFWDKEIPLAKEEKEEHIEEITYCNGCQVHLRGHPPIELSARKETVEEKDEEEKAFEVSETATHEDAGSRYDEDCPISFHGEVRNDLTRLAHAFGFIVVPALVDGLIELFSLLGALFWDIADNLWRSAWSSKARMYLKLQEVVVDGTRRRKKKKKNKRKRDMENRYNPSGNVVERLEKLYEIIENINKDLAYGCEACRGEGYTMMRGTFVWEVATESMYISNMFDFVLCHWAGVVCTIYFGRFTWTHFWLMILFPLVCIHTTKNKSEVERTPLENLREMLWMVFSWILIGVYACVKFGNEETMWRIF